MNFPARAAAAVLAISSLGLADPAPPVTATAGAELREPRVRPGGHLHDGFFLRLGTGFGAYQERVFAKMGHDEPHSTVTGVGTASELMIGGNVSRRLVLGGGTWGTSVLASDVTLAKGSGGAAPSAAATDLSGTPSLTLLGPFLTYYFDPTGGLSVYGALGLASSRAMDPAGGKFDREDIARGAGAALGVSYDWWVGEEWSVGVSARAAGAATSRKVGDERAWHMVVTSPSVLFTVTYH